MNQREANVPQIRGQVNPLRRSAVMVDWESVFVNLFRKISPDRVGEIKEVLNNFQGMYEAAFTSLCRYHNVTVPVEYQPIPIEPTSEWARFRVARLLLKRSNNFSPSVLEDILDIMKNGNPNIEFEKLESKYGFEPFPDESFSFSERITLTCAMQHKMEARHQLLTAMSMAADQEEKFKDIIENIGGEYQWEDIADPRDLRARLKVFLLQYDKPLVGKLDSIMEAADDPIALFTKLQRTHGREPMPKVIADSGNNSEHQSRLDASRSKRDLMNASSESQVLRDSFGDAVATEAQLQIQMQLNYLESLRNDIFLLPINSELSHRRLPIFDDIRTLILQSNKADLNSIERITSVVFSELDRVMLPVAKRLTQPRITEDHDYESHEWLQFLYCCYVNAVPPGVTTSLRTVVSLLVRKYGAAIWEVQAAGGLDAYISKVETQDQVEGATHMRMMYGAVPDESELALRSRQRLWFHWYNRSVPRDKIDSSLEKLFVQNRESRWDELLKNKFGPPPPLPFDIQRLERRSRGILRRHAHLKEHIWKTVVEAHIDVGDNKPEDVIQNLVRTYGPEHSAFDDKFETEICAEFESRFQIFAHEMRTRDVIIRRATSTLSQNDNNDSKKIGNREVEQRLQVQRLLVASKAEEERKKQEKHQNDMATLQLSQIDTLLAEEDFHRKDIETEERALKEPIISLVMAVTDSDENVTIDVIETLKRHFLLDSARSQLRKLKETMVLEEEHLRNFLGDRMLWRKKWERDEEIRIAILEMKDYEMRKLEEDRIAKEEAKKLSKYQSQSAKSVEQTQVIKDLYEQLNAQTQKNLSFQVQVDNHRARYRSEIAAKVQPTLDFTQYVVPITTLRPRHHGCYFENKERFSATTSNMSTLDANPYGAQIPNYLTGTEARTNISSVYEEPEMTEDQVNYMFLGQLREYIQQLFRKYDPKLEGTEGDLLRQFAGNEAKLIAALEQQYNVDHWVETRIHSNVTKYYQRMAPESMDEIPSIIQRFIGNEEAMWAYLVKRHGPVPALQSKEMQKYIHARLLRYMSQRPSAAHLIKDIDRYIIIIGDTNGDEFFRELAREHGPEDYQIQLDTLIRKLSRFYRERGIRRQIDDVPILAKKFLGHENALNRLLLTLFDDTLNSKHPDVSDLGDKRTKLYFQN